MADAISRYMIYQQSESAATFAARVLPYPPKPEKTVTLSGGQVWRRKGSRFEYHTVSGWCGFRDDDDIRALASLLPENDP